MLVVPMDTRYWTENGQYPKGDRILRVRRIQQALGVGDKPLHLPPKGRIDSTGKIIGDTLPAVRFPGWMHCEHCGRLYRSPWEHPSDKDLYCKNQSCGSKGRLVQVPWVLVHSNGYMDEIPWHWLAHRNNKKDAVRSCRQYDQLSWKDNVIQCEACGAKNKFFSESGLSENLFFKGLPRMRQQPWLLETVPELELGQAPPVARRVGDVRIYVAVVARGIVIPPESRMTESSPRNVLEGMPAELDLLRALQAKNTKQFQRKLDNVARKLRFSSKALVAVLDELGAGSDSDDQDFSGDLLGEEFKALTTPIPDLREEEDFITEHFSAQWHAFRGADSWTQRVKKIIGLVDKVVAVPRLREIQVYKGFTRLVAQPETQNRLVPPDIEGRQNWLPALERFGEGIFIALREETIGAWEQNAAVVDRCTKTMRRLNREQLDGLPRFILLHTLAHLMIRQIEFDSGYPAAEIRERIYARQASGQATAMAGILIYTAVPDVAGSLGGLVELARPARLLAILERVFTHAEWCALDPVCAEHEGQGPKLLNRAACHACTLLPEPSCAVSESFLWEAPSNTLLDRVLIKGSAPSEESREVPALLDWVE